MTQFPEKYFDKWYWLACSVIFIGVVLRCINVPFAHDEVATFNFYIQRGDFLPFLSHPDANGHFLMSATSWVCFKLVGSSPLALRLPCIMAFGLLCYGVFKMNKLFPAIFTKIIFSSAFILSFHFISFYSLCRGYGMSMAFLMLALYYFFVYLRWGAFSHFVKFIGLSQLALSANLTLVMLLLITSAIVIAFQFKNKVFFKVRNLFVLLIHFLLLVFWIRFGFFLKEKGALYYGGGEGYWKTTFESLIEIIFFKSSIINYSIVTVFFIMLVYWIYKFFKGKMDFIINNSFAVSFFTLCSLIGGFYFLKKIAHVNYPEDRTGLFFYVLFIISFCFMLNGLKQPVQIGVLVVPVFFLVHFLLTFNILYHPWRIYETMPARFFSILKEEQEHANHRITIGGHRVREFFYAFLNYKSRVKLNHMTAPEALQMNCDYALAYKEDKPYYERYYTELATDNYWDFRLLKRRIPLERKLLYSSNNIPVFTGDNEYYNSFEKLDTTYNSENPLVADFEFSVDKAPEPFNAWFVLQIDDADGINNTFVRVPLNLVRYDWNGANFFTTSLVSGNIPLKIKRIVAYLWNIDKQEINIKMDSFKLYQLNGEGVKEISKAKI
jgi:hypothetical protein